MSEDDYYAPYTGKRQHGESDAKTDPDAESVNKDSALHRRPAPPGMSRKDRKVWDELEGERLAQLGHQVRAGSSTWGGGFSGRIPKGLRRRGRRSYLHASRRYRRKWWAERQSENAPDASARAVGALVVVLVLGGLLLWRVMATRTAETPTATSPSTSTVSTPAVAAVQTGASSTTGATDSANLGGSAASAVGGAATETVPPSTVVPSAAQMSGRWVPNPAGGVTPVLPRIGGPAVDPSSVQIITPSAAGPVAQDLASPTAVVLWWGQHICPSSWRQSFGTNALTVRPAMTAGAWVATDPTNDSDGRQVWQTVVERQQTRKCGQVRATVSSDMPVKNGTAYVLFFADRVVSSELPGKPAVVERFSGTRVVQQQSNGAWLIGAPIAGG